ncbi:MAG: hypothetical protein IPP64_10115 [Bacteroidetes bacterium]|nr:hypothetical protein [Bacteroidota bacterium]
MIEISNDNNLIYLLLEKADALPQRFDIDAVLAFDLEDSFYVVVYLAGNRNFISFRAKEYLQDNNALIYMQQVVENGTTHEIPALLVDEALQLIEHKMHTKKNNRYFFDAH